jgi:hypothetical protein
MDSTGTVLAVWGAQAVRYSPTGGLGPVHTMRSDDGKSVGISKIALDKAGNVMAMWHQGPGWNLYAGRFNIFAME